MRTGSSSSVRSCWRVRNSSAGLSMAPSLELEFAAAQKGRSALARATRLANQMQSDGAVPWGLPQDETGKPAVEEKLQH
jgi:hypothetical protein|eukprot:COSAG02_NODE_4975_length_4766_cov_53.167345_2_plen_79_part_00